MTEISSTLSSNSPDDKSTEIKLGCKLLEGEPFNYDKILEYLGQIGKFQLHTFLWLSIAAFFPGIVILSFTFTGAVPEYR